MPWCPNCRAEYRKGITLCADCNVELVESLEDEAGLTLLLLTAEADGEEVAVRFKDFLRYSDIPARIVKNAEGQFEVYTLPERFPEAKRCFQAFQAGEAQRVAEEAEQLLYEEEEEDTDAEDADETASPKASAKKSAMPEKQFKSAVSSYEDYRSSAYVFSTVGALGICFALLNIIGIINLFHIFSSIVILAMFGVFFGFGVYSFTRLEELKAAADKETEQVTAIQEWLKANVNSETIGKYRLSLTPEGAEQFGIDMAMADDISYLHELELIRNDLLKEFPDFSVAYAEQIVDEYYNDTFTDN